MLNVLERGDFCVIPYFLINFLTQYNIISKSKSPLLVHPECLLLVQFEGYIAKFSYISTIYKIKKIIKLKTNM